MNKQAKIAEIQEDIRYYRRQITSDEGQLQAQRNRRAELENIYQSLGAAIQHFQEVQYRQQQKIDHLQKDFQNIKFSKKLSSNLTDALQGSNARNSSRGMDEKQRLARTKLYEADRRIEDIQNRIRRWNVQIDNLEYELWAIKYS